jgi:hypothetical protein
MSNETRLDENNWSSGSTTCHDYLNAAIVDITHFTEPVQIVNALMGTPPPNSMCEQELCSIIQRNHSSSRSSNWCTVIKKGSQPYAVSHCISCVYAVECDSRQQSIVFGGMCVHGHGKKTLVQQISEGTGGRSEGSNIAWHQHADDALQHLHCSMRQQIVALEEYIPERVHGALVISSCCVDGSAKLDNIIGIIIMQTRVNMPSISATCLWEAVRLDLQLYGQNNMDVDALTYNIFSSHASEGVAWRYANSGHSLQEMQECVDAVDVSSSGYDMKSLMKCMVATSSHDRSISMYRFLLMYCSIING